jgi:hypothetical protein
VLARDSAVGLPEALEDVGQKFGADPCARVGDGDLGAVARAREPHLDRALARRELDGVREEVPEDLLETVGVAGDAARRVVEAHREADAARLGRRAHALGRRLDDGREGDGARRQAELAGDDARHVEEVVDELRLRLRVALDGFERARGDLRVELLRAQELRPAQHGR